MMGTTPEQLADDWERYNEGDNADPTGTPVDVRIVGPLDVTDHPPRNIVTDQVALSTAAPAVRVVGEVRARARLTIVARGGDAYLMASSDGTIGTGFMIPAGAGYETTATCAFYALGAAPGVVLHVIAEHRDGA